MKIDKNIDTDNFIIKSGEFIGQPSILIVPQHMGCGWTQDNKIFRSSIWSEDGELLSAGFPKFTNFGENPEVFPVPNSLKGVEILDKMDGSLCICDSINGQLSMRTRGTFSYKTLHNWKDFEYCREKYPKISEWLKSHPDISLLFEITTPHQQIVIHYGDEPDLTLIGGIRKDDYSYVRQDTLDVIASDIDVKRPVRYNADSIGALIKTMKESTGIEGCVLYSNNGQTLHKIKSEQYLKFHHLKTNLNDRKLYELIEFEGFKPYVEFKHYIIDEFDWEIWEAIELKVKMIYTVHNSILHDLNQSWDILANAIKSNSWDISQHRGDIARFITNVNCAIPDHNVAMLFMKIDDKFDMSSDKVKRWLKNIVLDQM